MFKRIVKLSKTHSFFPFGARATGKSTLLEQSFDPRRSLWVDLLDPEMDDRLSREPSLLKNMIATSPEKKIIVIDEVLKYGSLPEIFSLGRQDKADFLRAYVETEQLRLTLEKRSLPSKSSES